MLPYQNAEINWDETIQWGTTVCIVMGCKWQCDLQIQRDVKASLHLMQETVERWQHNSLQHEDFADKIDEMKCCVDEINTYLKTIQEKSPDEDVIGDIIHDIRSPLSSISLRLDLLRRVKSNVQKCESIVAGIATCLTEMYGLMTPVIYMENTN